MGYLGPEPQLADAYRVTARGVRAALARDEFAAQRTRELTDLLRRPTTGIVTAVFGEATGDGPRYGAATPIGQDFAGWLAEQGEREIAAAIFSADERARLADQYVAARVRHEADRRDWTAESIDAIAFERAGGF